MQLINISKVTRFKSLTLLFDCSTNYLTPSVGLYSEQAGHLYCLRPTRHPHKLQGMSLIIRILKDLILILHTYCCLFVYERNSNYDEALNHRRGIYIEEKAKVVAATLLLVQNSQRGKKWNKFCPSNSSDEHDLCLLFCIEMLFDPLAEEGDASPASPHGGASQG